MLQKQLAKTMIALSLCLLLLVLALFIAMSPDGNCLVTNVNFEKLGEGMTKEEVSAVLGYPDTIGTMEEIETHLRKLSPHSGIPRTFPEMDEFYLYCGQRDKDCVRLLIIVGFQKGRGAARIMKSEGYSPTLFAKVLRWIKQTLHRSGGVST